MEKRQSLREKLNKINNITARDYILNYSHEGISKFATVLLALLCILPIVYNMIYNIYDKINIPETEVSFFQVFDYIRYWRDILCVLGFFMVLFTIYQVISLHYRTNLKNVFHFAWIKDRWLPICLLLLLFWSFLSALVCDNPIHSLLGDHYRYDGVFTFCLFGVIFLTCFLPSEKQIKTICEILVIVACITGFMVTLGKDNASILFFQTQRLENSIFVNSNHFGYFLAICFPILVGLVINDKSKNIFLILGRIAEFWLLTNAMMVSRCRGSFIAIIVALVGWNIYIFWLKRSKWQTMVAMDVLFVTFILFLNTDNEILKRMVSIGTEIKDASESGSEEDIAKIGSFRGVLWQLGIESSFNKPIFGYGPDKLKLEYKGEIYDKPHNELIEIAASLGYPALIFYLAGIIGHMVLFFKNIKKVSILEVAVFSAVCSYFVSALFGNVMFYTTPYYYLMLGFSYILLRRTPDAKPLFANKSKKISEEEIAEATEGTDTIEVANAIKVEDITESIEIVDAVEPVESIDVES